MNRCDYGKTIKSETCLRSHGWEQTQVTSSRATPAWTPALLSRACGWTLHSLPCTLSHINHTGQHLWSSGLGGLRCYLNALIRRCEGCTPGRGHTLSPGRQSLPTALPHYLSLVDGSSHAPLWFIWAQPGTQSPHVTGVGSAGGRTVPWAVREGSENRGWSWMLRTPMGGQWEQR